MDEAKKQIKNFINSTKDNYSKEEVVTILNSYISAIYEDVMCVRSYGCHEDAIEKNKALETIKQCNLSDSLYIDINKVEKFIDNFINSTKDNYSKEEVLDILKSYISAIYNDVMCVHSYGCHEDAIEKNKALVKINKYKLSYSLHDNRNRN